MPATHTHCRRASHGAAERREKMRRDEYAAQHLLYEQRGARPSAACCRILWQRCARVRRERSRGAKCDELPRR